MIDTIITSDVAVIGAGPSGLFSVFECGMLGLKTVVFDSLAAIGGQCTALYPEKPIYDIPGCPSVLAGELISNLEKQAAPFSPVYMLDQQITSLQPDGDGWRLQTSKNVHAKVRAIIIAAGGGAFGPNRPPLEGIEQFENKSVFYMVRRKADFTDKRIVIAGGGDSAVDWALSLAPIAKTLSIVHRRDKFRAAPESVRLLNEYVENGRIEIVAPYQLAGLSGENGLLHSVAVKTLDGACRELEADILLPFFGLANDLGPIADWGLAEQGHVSVNPETMQTKKPGIYAVGDIAAYAHKLKLILTGFNEAALAAHAIRKYLYPGEVRHFEYSTTKGLPS